jgi:hypothetical protein
MKKETLAIVLIVLGVLALTYEGISYTRRENVIDLGPIHATVETRRTIPVSPILGALAVAGGAMMLLWPRRA